MKLREIILQNFRGYYQETRIPVCNLTALIGQNDVGKSTVLEALDIFFNQAKIDISDKNVFHTQEDTVIGCIFDELPSTLCLEEVQTTFSAEYLLNSDGLLEIRKKYPTTCKQTVWIYAKHPSNEGFNDLLSKKNSELKAKIRSLGLEGTVNLTINSEMRRALWASLGESLELSDQHINAEIADEKKLWPKIEPLLPAYRLFKADRPSTDEDSEAQDPMRHAIETAIKEQEDQLQRIANEVQQKVTEVAANTIEKLKEFDPSLAATLTPNFKKAPAWDKAFSFSLTADNAVPLNKRGSGVRRLVLFSFFRATTESRLFDGKKIIYAVEEPETSQHPDAQKAIIKTFLDMVEENDCQIILTTHVPGLAGYIPLDSLRYITNAEGNPEISTGNDEGILKRVADTLGVYPDIAPALAPHHGVKVIVCVEGPNDIAFLNAISKMVHLADNSIVDLSMTSEAIIIPLGGSVLKDWVNYNYLQKLNTREYHIYDSDNQNAHQAECNRVNLRTDGSSARLTTKREMENYLHQSVIQEVFHVTIDVNDTMDVSSEISNRLRETNPTAYNPDTVKKKLNKLAAPKMTMEMLRERDQCNEVIGWLRDISSILNA